LEQFSESEILVDGKRSENHIQPSLAKVAASEFILNPLLQEEVFGSFALIVECEDDIQLLQALETLNGQLTGSLFVGKEERVEDVFQLLQTKVGRVILNGVPTGVEVSVAQQHGGPFPSSSRMDTTAVGADAIFRFMRPVAFQNCPDDLLPPALKKENPLGILRFVNGNYTY
jgi:NADP-dependent aldehyde dehydrogenase